eukprot:gene5358-biopygen8406
MISLISSNLQGRRVWDDEYPHRSTAGLVAGTEVEAYGLLGATEFNGRRGRVIAAANGGRIDVDFGTRGRKALRPELR